MLLGVDVGGTFTDAVLVGSDGGVTPLRSPTTPGREQDGVMRGRRGGAVPRGRRAGARRALRARNDGRDQRAATSPEGRPSARTALVATEGFTDVVELGRQARASLYRLCEPRPAPLAPAELRFAARERMGPDGPFCGL